MRISGRPLALALFALAVLPMSGGTQTRTNTLTVRASVVRTCAIQTDSDTVAMTCSRGGATAGVVTQSGPQPSTRVVAVPDRTTTVVARAETRDGYSESEPADETNPQPGPTRHRVVTVNF
jgi:hypothetical protein